MLLTGENDSHGNNCLFAVSKAFVLLQLLTQSENCLAGCCVVEPDVYRKERFQYLFFFFFFLAYWCNQSVSEEAFLSMHCGIGCISIITCGSERIPLSTCVCAVQRLTSVTEPVFLMGLFRSPV